MIRPALLCLLLATPALAEPSATQSAKVQALWSIAFDDWSPLFTCGATNGPSDDFLRQAWGKTRDQALAAMEKAGWPKDDLATLRARAEPHAMRLPPDTPFAEVLAYCRRHDDWVERSIKVKALPIGAEVAKVLGAAP